MNFLLTIIRQIYQLLLEYKFNMSSDGEEVTPRAMLLNGVLYESPLEAQFWMLFDSNKKLLGSGDAWPDSVKASKGENVLRLSVRHDQMGLLENLKDLVLVLERQLKNSKVGRGARDLTSTHSAHSCLAEAPV
jgi:tripeptidyl-peptidase II